MTKYTRTSNVFNIGYHLIFCPKYRKPYFFKFQNIIKHHFQKIANKLDFIIEELDIMPDHVHLFIRCKTLSTTVSSIVHKLKGGASFVIRKRYPFLKKYKSFWSPSYFCESIGNMSEDVIRKYIRNQKINMKSSYKHRTLVLNSNIFQLNTTHTHLKIKNHNRYGKDKINEKTTMSTKYVGINECI